MRSGWERDGWKVPADSFPITRVIGEDCEIALLRAVFAEERKETRDARGGGIMEG